MVSSISVSCTGGSSDTASPIMKASIDLVSVVCRWRRKEGRTGEDAEVVGSQAN
jgi:hypothetical protein